MESMQGLAKVQTTAAQGAAALSATYHRVNQAAQSVPIGAMTSSSIPLSGAVSKPLTLRQQRLAQYMAPFRSLPKSERLEKILQWHFQEMEEKYRDLLTATGELSPDNFQRAVRVFITHYVADIHQSLIDRHSFLLNIDPLLLEKVRQGLVDLVMKLDDRKLFSAQELTAIFDANVRLYRRFFPPPIAR